LAIVSSVCIVAIVCDCSANLDVLHRQQVAKDNEYREQISDLSALCAIKDEEVESNRQHVADYKKRVALDAINSRSGKPIPPQASLNLSPCPRHPHIILQEPVVTNSFLWLWLPAF